ncbi:hypothetical protein Fmac_003820 [Flemingia macrophylla]|uniref:cyclin-dependent kinase n=1 Tax=Flemingia macrophylla TaxID=520843 RepID=A0ABD1N385_9FABA
MDPPSKSWSIHTRSEVIAKYEVMERVGSGAYADVYRGRRLSDGLIVALKEIHDYQSAFREIHALQLLQGSPNVVVLHDYFYRDDDDAVLVLEFLRTDLATVISDAAKASQPLPAAELKRWMLQILSGVDACHRHMVLHRDLKPSNLLISEHGLLKIADFGQARILTEPGFDASNDNEEYSRVLDDTNNKDINIDIPGGNATCTASDIDREEEEEEQGKELGCFTSCVGTRWFRAPELLYGSRDYGLEVDLWSLGCIFAELLTLQPLFPGTADIDQLSRIIGVLGNLDESAWVGCSELPDYGIISFSKVENPAGLESCLPNRSPDEVALVKRLVCYDPAKRATAMELLHDKYFREEPLPVPVSELRVPLTRKGQDEDSPREWDVFDEDSDFDEFGPLNFTRTGTGFSIQFP